MGGDFSPEDVQIFILEAKSEEVRKKTGYIFIYSTDI